MDQITTRLGRDEGQFSAVSADEELENIHTHEKKHVGWTFFMNAQGTNGYALRMDAPLGQSFQQACIQYKLRDIILYDNREQQKSPLDFAITNVDKQKAIEGCKNTQDPICGFHNEWMRIYAEDVRANVTIKAMDSEGRMFFLFGTNYSDLAGNISVTTSAGTFNTQHAFTHVQYRPNGIQYLNSRNR